MCHDVCWWLPPLLFLKNSKACFFEQCRGSNPPMLFPCLWCDVAVAPYLLDDCFQGEDVAVHRQLTGPGHFAKTRKWKSQEFIVLYLVVSRSHRCKSSSTCYICTKRFLCNRFEALMCLLGMFDVSPGVWKGSNDPGNVFRRKQFDIHSQRFEPGQCERMRRGFPRNLITCGFLRNRFCNTSGFYNCVFGLLCILFWTWINLCWTSKSSFARWTRCRMSGSWQQKRWCYSYGKFFTACSTSPIPEPAEPSIDSWKLCQVVFGQMPSKARSNCVLDRWRLYEETGWRSFLVYDRHWNLHTRCCENQLAQRYVSDEFSPSYSGIHDPARLGEAQRALAFIQRLQAGAASSTGCSTHVDMIANGHLLSQAQVLVKFVHRLWGGTSYQPQGKYLMQIYDSTCIMAMEHNGAPRMDENENSDTWKTMQSKEEHVPLEGNFSCSQ